MVYDESFVSTYACTDCYFPTSRKYNGDGNLHLNNLEKSVRLSNILISVKPKLRSSAVARFAVLGSGIIAKGGG